MTQFKQQKGGDWLAERKEYLRLVHELASWARTRGFDEELNILPNGLKPDVLLQAKVNNNSYLFIGRAFVVDSVGSIIKELESTLESYVVQLHKMIERQQVSGGTISISTNNQSTAYGSALLLRRLYKTHNLSIYEDKATRLEAVQISEDTWVIDAK